MEIPVVVTGYRAGPCLLAADDVMLT